MAKKSVKKTRNAERTRTHILEVAFMEVFQKGFQGVSVNDILESTSLTKGAFFHHFPTKQDLGYALVDETLRHMTVDRWIRPLEKFEDPVEGILSNLKQKIDSLDEVTIGWGCPLNNLIQEMSNVDPVFRKKLHEVLEVWIEGVENALKKAQLRSYLRKDVNARRLAEFIVTNHEGAFGMMKSMRDKKVFKSLHAGLKDYLETMRP